MANTGTDATQFSRSLILWCTRKQKRHQSFNTTNAINLDTEFAEYIHVLWTVQAVTQDKFIWAVRPGRRWTVITESDRTSLLLLTYLHVRTTEGQCVSRRHKSHNQTLQRSVPISFLRRIMTMNGYWHCWCKTQVHANSR